MMVKHMDKKYKLLLPKYLSFSRIMITPIIILLGIFKLNLLCIILTVLFASTSILDTLLSKLWKTVSNKRTKLDLLANKIFIIGIIASMMFNYNILIIILILEILISLINIFFYNKTNKIEILLIGKIKTVIITITIVVFMINYLTDINSICNGFSYASINLQILSCFYYIYFYIRYIKNKPSINNNLMHKSIMQDKSLEDTIILNDITNLEDH